MKKNIFKKLIAIALCATMALSCTAVAGAVTKESTVAVDSSATDEVTIESCYHYFDCTKLPKPTELDEETRLAVIDDYISAMSFGSYGTEKLTRDDVTVEYYGSLDDGSMLVKPHSDKLNYPALTTYVPFVEEINSIYVFEAGQEVFIYRNNRFYSIEELYKNGELTGSDLECIANNLHMDKFITKDSLSWLIETVYRTSIEPGNTYTEESLKAYENALEYAKNIESKENATTAECTKAYFELEKTSSNLELLVVDKAKLSDCYYYCERLLRDAGDYLTQEDKKFISDLKFDAQITLLYPENEEYFYSKTDELVQKLLDYKMTTDHPDVLSYAEVLKIEELAKARLEAEQTYDPEIGLTVGNVMMKSYNGYFLINASTNIAMEVLGTERFNGYIIEDNDWNIPSKFGCLAINPETNDVITLEDGINNGTIDTAVLYKEYCNTTQYPFFPFKMYMLGDINGDKELSIKDVTELQKALAGMREIKKTYYGTDSIFDFNGDGDVDVKDATAIQKALTL